MRILLTDSSSMDIYTVARTISPNTTPQILAIKRGERGLKSYHAQ